MPVIHMGGEAKVNPNCANMKTLWYCCKKLFFSAKTKK